MEKCEPYSFASEIGPPVKYRLAVAIGAGGFGRVFRAFAVEAEGDSPGVYAVKRLPLRGTVNGKSEEEGFTNRDWQKLIQVSKHDNLVRYYAAHTACLDSDPQHFGHVVMELCEGMDLAGYLGSDEHRIDKKWIVLVACQVLKGMGHLHSFEVIHGDLKPANVFLVKTEHTVVAKIGDFDDRIKPASESETNDGIQGTAAYMSPEMMWTRIAKVDHVVDTACLHEITTKTDVWSFGCILFEMECRYRKMTDRFLTNENGTKGTGLDRSAETLYNYVVNYKCFPRVPDQSVPSLKRLLRACFAYDSKDRPAALELLNLSFLACKREKQHPPPPSVAEPPYLAPPTPAPSAMQFVSPAQAPESLSFKKLEGS